jgi:hypothetical protein
LGRRLPRWVGRYRSRGRGRGQGEGLVLPSVPLVRVESATTTAGSGGGDGGGIGGLLDGMERRSGRAGDGDGDGGGDINEQSWLRSASGSRGCLGEEEEEGVDDDLGRGYGHGCGTLAGRDGLRPRSGPTQSLGGGWRATFAGRWAALAWEQRRREDVGGNPGLGHVGTNAVEDPAGLGGVESVMRELVLGRGIGGEARDTHTR